MRQSKLFLRTQREFPKDEVAVNSQLLLKANFVHKLMAGVYSLLPLGFRVREKIIRIIREEMDKLGAEILMPALHPRSVWEPTNRWQVFSKVMYQFKDHGGREIGLGPTHEEVVAEIGKNIIFSYDDLPLAVYQIQTKFRDEARPKSGLLRGREFTMKDLYSFHIDEFSLEEFYERTKESYEKIFRNCGLKSYITEASGGDFSKYSHEFMVVSEAGEDEIFFCPLCNWSQNKEIAEVKDGDSCSKCHDGVLEKKRAIEVGNIFKLGTKFSAPINFLYKDKTGQTRPVVMGSYGIGIERLLGTIVEVHHDDSGIIWPESVAPFRVHLLLIGETKEELKKFGEKVYNGLVKEGVEVLYDDRARVTAGEKFTDADLIGIPYRAVVSEKTLVQDKIEIKKRNEKEVRLLKFKELLNLVK